MPRSDPARLRRFLVLAPLGILCLGGVVALLALARGDLDLAAPRDGARAEPDGAEAARTVTDPSTTGPTSTGPVSYGRDVRPLLSDRCYTCHGPDAATRKAGLRLDDRASAIAARDGVRAIVPGDASSSELWRRITSDDPALRMPPGEANKAPLSERERDAIRRWIDGGAAFEPHWAFTPPRSATPPAAPKDGPPPRNDVDRFVFARLAEVGLAPSPVADDETLVRRVFLDLTGLPPTPEEIDAYTADRAADKYDRLVDRLLDTEPYRSRAAEHFATPWLDAARYADTCGIHTDNGRQIWLWRDWVLEALRDNMPFDRFATEQLAGDLLPNATTAQRIASGFNRNHVTTDEGGVIPEEYLVEYAADRASTTASVFLGLTVHCARCHDHKFDPISQTDFYRLFAYFNSVDEPGLYSQTEDPDRAYEPAVEVPSPHDAATLKALAAEIAVNDAVIERPIKGEGERRATFVQETARAAGITWTVPAVIDARSTAPKVKLVPQADGAVLATGEMPDREDYTIRLRIDAAPARLLLLEALATPGKGPGAGRAKHGNAVVSAITVAVRDREGIGAWSDVPLAWAWADHTQRNRDFEPGNVLAADDGLGWAADGNENAGERMLIVAAREPLAGKELRVRIAFRSKYPRHAFGRVRVRVGRDDGNAREVLSPALGRWYAVGPFQAAKGEDALDSPFGPETLPTIDRKHNFGAGNRYWKFAGDLADGRPNAIGPPRARRAKGTPREVHYAGRTIWSVGPCTFPISLAVDAPYRVFLNGREIASRRSLANTRAPRDLTLALEPGANALVLKVLDAGGTSFSFHARPEAPVLPGSLLTAILPQEALTKDQRSAFARAWRRRAEPRIRSAEEARARARARLDRIRARVPRTMVMQERSKPRTTYVLERGQYDHPDKSRPVRPGIPTALGSVPADAPPDRRGLAAWIVSAENPLTSRVAANRIWQMLFGVGLVSTPGDFGFQGAWPTHPALLDCLAVTLRTSGWDQRALVKSIVRSHTYRQSSGGRPEAAKTDPQNRRLWRYPRRRLGAEQIRDQALYVAGLLVERFGGASVKPYQPPGLWREVSMVASNTRDFEPDTGEALWRRSLYTYWKRACPPPTLQTFDAPTRESCVLYRPTTNTPLQALALWNDVQFVEAARALAARTLAGDGDDRTRIVTLFRRCTGRRPDAPDLERLAASLASFRKRYRGAPADAARLLALGDAPRHSTATPPELAAWTLLSSAVLNLHETLTQD